MNIRKVNFNETFIYSLISIAFISILYFETINISGLKIAHLWKALFLYLLIILSFTTKNKIDNKILNIVTVPFIFYTFWPLLTFFVDFDLWLLIVFFVRLSLFVFFVDIFTDSININNIRKFLIIICSFCLFSFLPFYFGLIDSYGKTINLNVYSDYNINTLVGVFQNPHSASLIVALSGYIFFVLSFTYRQRACKFLCMLAFFFSVLLLVLIGVRSGMLLLVISTIVFILGQSAAVKLHYFIGLTVLGIASFAIYSYGAFLPYVNKFIGIRKYADELNLYQVSSGRDVIWSTSIDILINDYSLLEVLAGSGYDKFTNYMEKYVGIKVFSHNVFLNELLIFGVFGFFILIYFLYSMFKISLMMNCKFGRFAVLGLFFGLLGFSFFQSLDYLPHFFLLPIFVKLFHEYSLDDLRLTMN